MIHNNAQLYNVAELIPAAPGYGQHLSRIPNALRLKLNPAAMSNALQAAGCEIRFNLIGDAAELTISAAAQNNFGADRPIAEIFQGCFQVGWRTIGPEPTTIRVTRAEHLDAIRAVSHDHDLPFDADLTRIVLPYRPALSLIEVKGEIGPPAPAQTPSTRYLAYGSSITQGHVSIRPTESWAMQTARALGVDLINLGFGGGAHLESEMADYIAERDDWDLATLEMGINMVGTFSAEEFAKRVDYFVERVARAHRDKWILCTDMFLFARPETVEMEEAKGFRQIVKDKVAQLDLPKLVYVPGTEILTRAEGLTGDLVHPSPIGMTMIADNMTRALQSLILKSEGRRDSVLNNT